MHLPQKEAGKKESKQMKMSPSAQGPSNKGILTV